MSAASYQRPYASRNDRERGASAVEYGLIIAAIAAVIAGTVFGLGAIVRSAFDKTCSAVSLALPSDGNCTGNTGN